MSRQLRPSANCLNCGHAVATHFCSQCGQENTDYRVSIGRLFGDLFEELFQLESRLWRSLWTLVRRPGLLTREYNAGRRVSYTTPLRLYLIASVSYFFIGSVMPRHGEEDHVKVELPEISAADKAELAKKSPLLAPYLERIREGGKDPKGTSHRVQQGLTEYAPRIAAGLVPLFAVLTWIFFRGPKLFFVEHLIFALHMHATGFLLLTLGELLPWWPIGTAVGVALTVLSFMAMRRVFGQSWLRTSWKFVLIWMVYGIALALGIGAVALFAFFAKAS